MTAGLEEIQLLLESTLKQQAVNHGWPLVEKDYEGNLINEECALINTVHCRSPWQKHKLL